MIAASRNTPNINGGIYFSSKTFFKNPNGWCDSLQNNYYKYPALVPPMPWIDSTKPAAPQYSIESSSNAHTIKLQLTATKNTNTKAFVIYSAASELLLQQKTAATMYKLQPSYTGSSSIELQQPITAQLYGFTVVDINNNESDITILKK
ncbi:MAG: hypothetical protein EAZ16_11190 [Sphingobacteriales bacterium]|nr:MAG: hypothetical protein EAZ16_11190 [Sphingobacteriales bacterium]